jgi:HTH-type transcriptional regulator/antitoxin HipB
MDSAKITPIGKISSSGDLGRLVRELREKQGATQVDLANFAKTGQRFIVELEAGKPTVRLDKVLQVLSILGVDLLAARRT